MSISLLRRLLMKEAVKDTAGSSGIMSINKNIADKVEQQVQRYVNDAMRQGVDLDTLSPEQLKMIVQMNKPKPPRVIAGDSPEGKGIMEALLGKRGEVVDMAGKKLDTSQGIMGGKSVKELMDSGQVSKGARGMKKSKKVQDREMFQGANKRLKTEAQLKAEMEANNKKGVAGIKKQRQLTDDEIRDYEAELGDSETWMMDGTVGEAETALKNQKAYMADMELQYKKGKLDPEPGSRTPQRKRFLQSKLDEAEASGDARLLSREEREELFDLDDIEDFADGGVAGLLGERPGYAIGNMVDQEDLGLGNMVDQEDEYDFSDIKGQTAFVGLPEIFALGTKVIGPMLKGGSASAILKNAAKEKLRQEIGKKIYKGIQKKITKPKYGTKSPTTTTTTRPGRRDRDIGGNQNVGGGNTATNALGQTASQATKAGTGTSQGYSQHFADGGITRQNFAMGKRAFLKMLAGAGAGIAGLKSGLIGFGGKKAAVKEVVKQSAGSGTPPPYFFKLAEKIKKLGSDTTPTNDRTIAKSLKSKDGKSDYILEEDVSSGDTIIKKVNKEGDEMITDVQIMELRKGEIVKGKDGKARKTPDEYEEVTEANARIEGDVFNDPYYSDGIEIDDILREVDDIPVPKASGGIARMLGE